jgi:hypothetical protein
MLLRAFQPPKSENTICCGFGGPGKTVASPPGAGFGGSKALSSMGEISTAEVLRLRAPSVVSRDKSVRRSAQDDDVVMRNPAHLGG